MAIEIVFVDIADHCHDYDDIYREYREIKQYRVENIYKSGILPASYYVYGKTISYECDQKIQARKGILFFVSDHCHKSNK